MRRTMRDGMNLCMHELFRNRKRLYHEVPRWVKDGAVFFITINTRPREVNQLCHPEMSDTIRESIAFRIQSGAWWPERILLMPDHLHGLIAFNRNLKMKQIVEQWKRYLAFQLSIQWQKNFFDHRIRSVREFHLKSEYIAQNPVRKGLVSNPKDWPYSWSGWDLV
ncbi:MAG: transposase [Opitutales bacterium]|nr:transposase [Opitutales bacterium]